MPGAPDTGLAALESELERLEARGARRHDMDGCKCVRALLEHAEQLGGEVAARLATRAALHLQALRERFERDRARVERALSNAEQERGELPELRRRLEQGELTAVARALRRMQVVSTFKPRRQLCASSGAAIKGWTPERLAERRRQMVAYEDSVAQLVASFALARATDGIPDGAGPYNPLRIASHVLDRMRAISPFYLTVQLNRLEELASLLNLPEPASPAAAKPPAKRRLKSSKG